MNSHDTTKRKRNTKSTTSNVSISLSPRFTAQCVNVQHYVPEEDAYVTTKTKIIINQYVLNYMNKLNDTSNRENSRKDQIFNAKTLKFVNTSVKNANYYILDRYGLILRKNCMDNKKSAFGWRYDDNDEPISLHISDILIKTNSNEIQILTLQSIKRQFPNAFKKPRGIYYKVYKEMFKNVDIEAL